jgi:hypothetical protein
MSLMLKQVGVHAVTGTGTLECAVGTGKECKARPSLSDIEITQALCGCSALRYASAQFDMNRVASQSEDRRSRSPRRTMAPRPVVVPPDLYILCRG